MKGYSLRSLLVLIALLLPASATAQWKNVAPNLVAGTDFGGAMQFRDGIVWAGGDNLWRSTDSGKTWLPSGNFVNANINDIAFFDKMNGLVGTEVQGIFHTSDGGSSWQQVITSGAFAKVAFNGSASVMHALDFSGIFYTSIDGGANWSSANVSNGTCRSFAVANDGTVYVQSASFDSKPYTGFVFVSTNLGQSWNQASGIMDGDCYTLTVDSCDSKRLYLVNEEVYDPTDSIAEIYLSMDGGQSWTITDSHHSLFYSGSLTTTSEALFAGTLDSKEGTFRSVDRSQTWKSIGGPALAPDSRNIAAINANTVLAMDRNGSIWLTTNGGGDSVQVVSSGTLALAPMQLFDGDTAECDSVVRSIQILRGGCPSPSVSSIIITGPDSANFRESVAGDSISVILLPRRPGTQHASLIANIDNGTSDTIALGGFIGPYMGTVTLSSDSLFSNDTLHCDSLTLPVYITASGCHPPPPTQILIAGRDSNSFHIGDSSSDSIAVEWTSQKPGAQQAWLIALLADGTRDSVALAGFSTTTPLVFSVAPQRLFSLDSDYIQCSSSVDTIRISANACLWPRVKSEAIDGMDSMDYSISHPLAQFDSSNSISILFTPADTGLRVAMYELTLDNDTVITIPLAGVGLATHKLSLGAASLNEKTDTIGGEVAVPITVVGLAHAETIELVLHYPLTDIEYDSSVNVAGVRVDIPGQQWPGRSKLRIVAGSDSGIVAYARFKVFSDTTYDPQVTFDSMNIPTALTPCEYLPPPAATATIYPLEGCGIQMLSRWVHLGQRPLFTIRPNPSSGAITINSSMDVGDVSIEVYDMLGAVCARSMVSIGKDSPAMLSLPLRNGIYYLRMISQDGETNYPIVIER